MIGYEYHYSFNLNICLEILLIQMVTKVKASMLTGNGCQNGVSLPSQRQTRHVSWAWGFAPKELLSLSRMRTISELMEQSRIFYNVCWSHEFNCWKTIMSCMINLNWNINQWEFEKLQEMPYFKKNLKPSSAEFFFITLHDFTTRASCSSVNPLPSRVLMISSYANF